MAEAPSEDVNSLIQNYQQTNKLLRGRAILLAIFFIIILGLLHTTRNNEQKREGYTSIIDLLSGFRGADSLKRDMDSIYFAETSNWDYSNLNNAFTSEQYNKLRFDLEKSDYKDKTPLYELIAEYDKEIKKLGLKTENYQINVLGFASPMSDWIYFAPIILLILYHDFTLNILYRRTLREKLRALNIERWKLGAEIFGVEYEQETPTMRFAKLMTNVFMLILLFLPLIPAFIGATFYQKETSFHDIQPFMLVVQWISPIVMSIEMLVIFYTENLWGAKKIAFWFKNRLTKTPGKFTFLVSLGYGVLLLFTLGVISYNLYEPPIFEFGFLAMVLFVMLILPVSEFFLHRFQNNTWLKGVRIMGRVFHVFLTLRALGFLLSSSHGFFPIEVTMVFIGVLFVTLILVISVYVWVFSGKKSENASKD